MATPLQVAAAISHLEGVKYLLDVGADPNCAGSRDGTKWQEGTYMAQFNDLGALPQD